MARERAKVRFELSRPALGLAALALVVALTWMFALGVFIGRRYSPDTYLPPPPPPPARPAQAVSPPQPPAAALPAQAPESAPAAPAAEAKGPADERFAEEMARQKRQADAVTTPQAKRPERKPGAKKAEPARQAPDAYAVQVGAFAEQGRAQAMVAQLTKAGFRAYLFRGQSQPRFRVRLGPYEKRPEAERAATTVGAKLGIRPYLLVGDDQMAEPDPIHRRPSGPDANWKLSSP